jgi:peptidoglycan/LPS O-acetylase OafA/YrhL
MEPYRRFAVFGQTWSLGVEEQFYLVWPLVLPWVLARARARLILPIAIVVSAAAMIAFDRDWLPMHAYALLAGCLLALLGPLKRRWWTVPVGALALYGALEVAPHLDRIYVYGPMLATPAAVLLVAGAVNGNVLLELPPLRFVGRISYALYLWHLPLLRLSHTTFGRSEAIPSVVTAVVVSVLSTLVLEEPLRRAWRRLQRTTPESEVRPEVGTTA